MLSTLVSRNVTVAGKRTSVRLEPSMWDALAELCRRENCTTNEICTLVARSQDSSSLTAAIRVVILSYFRNAATEEGHLQAGHGQAGHGQHRATAREQFIPRGSRLWLDSATRARS